MNPIRMCTCAVVQAYRQQTSMFDGREYRWAGTTALWANSSRANSTDGTFIEFVTSPNNPDALLREPVLRGSAAAIVDHAYYWPHFTHIPAPADEDIMMFTVSKPSGHAGSRFGYVCIYESMGRPSDIHLTLTYLMLAALHCAPAADGR
jgi:aspartate/methionine/tyrosine aminotransferase